MCVQQSNTVDICDIKCVWRALCMADCCDKDSAKVAVVTLTTLNAMGFSLIV